MNVSGSASWPSSPTYKRSTSPILEAPHVPTGSVTLLYHAHAAEEKPTPSDSDLLIFARVPPSSLSLSTLPTHIQTAPSPATIGRDKESTASGNSSFRAGKSPNRSKPHCSTPHDAIGYETAAHHVSHADHMLSNPASRS